MSNGSGLGPPTLAGFQSFIINVMGITAITLPPTDPVVSMAYNIAIDIVNLQLQAASPDIYTLAVYNLGGSNIVNYAPDQPNAPIYLNNMPFFAYMRKQWDIYGLAQGVIQSSSDVSTSESMVVPEWSKDLTMADLQYRKDPWGAHYLALAQRYGTIWGLSQLDNLIVTARKDGPPYEILHNCASVHDVGVLREPVVPSMTITTAITFDCIFEGRKAIGCMFLEKEGQMIPGTSIIGGGGTPLGYQQISAATLAAATALTIPTGATVAIVSVDTAPVRWRDDGTSPTATVGMQLVGTATLSPSLAFGAGSMTAVKFILASGSPVLNVSYY